MNLDALIRRAAQMPPPQLEQVRARRAVHEIQREYARRLAEGPEITTDVDLRDPYATEVDDVVRISRAAQLAKTGVVVWDARRHHLDWSGEMSILLGYAPGERQPSGWRLLSHLHEDDRDATLKQVIDAWRQGTAVELTFRIVRANNTIYAHSLVEILTTADGSPYGLIATTRDATRLELARQERDRITRRNRTIEVSHISHDAETGLLDASPFADELDRAHRAGTGALLVITAPPLTRTQNSGEHDGHDRDVAAAIAATITKIARPADICGRLGPHEYGVVMPYAPLDVARPVADEILDGLRNRWFMAGAVRLDAYGGLVRYDHRVPITTTDLLIDAETAWRQATRTDQPLYVLTDTPSAEQRHETVRARVRAAVAGDRFTLHAQPILDLNLNQVVRHEILLRTLDNAGDPHPPTALLSLAEHVDEIIAVDRWVVANAMRLIGQTPQTTHYQLNLSGRSLADPGMLGHIRDAIARHSVNPEQITFEITETALAANLTEARKLVNGLRELGCQIALDDFGTGYTSLAYLKYLPVDLLKIDGDFIRDLPNSAADQEIVRTIVDLCRTLGIRTAAEYVQDDAALTLLRQYGVDFAQGYHIGRPQPVATRRHRNPYVDLSLQVVSVPTGETAEQSPRRQTETPRSSADHHRKAV